MTVRRLDSNGDIATSGQQFISGQPEIAQTIKTRLRLFTGEYFRNTQEGTDWFGKVLGKGQGLAAAELTIKRRIQETQGVLGFAAFDASFDLETRRLSLSCTVLTPYGNTPLTFESDI